MTVQEVKKEIIRVIIDSTETEMEITENTHFFNDMGLTSIEVVVLLADLEEAFGITISASEIRQVKTVGDMCQCMISIMLRE